MFIKKAQNSSFILGPNKLRTGPQNKKTIGYTLRGHCKSLSNTECSADENINNTASARKYELFSMN
jgi:hypothetical protein